MYCGVRIGAWWSLIQPERTLFDDGPRLTEHVEERDMQEMFKGISDQLADPERLFDGIEEDNEAEKLEEAFEEIFEQERLLRAERFAAPKKTVT